MPGWLQKLTAATALVVLAMLAGCGSNDERIDARGDADEIYAKARKAMDNGNYNDAVGYLEALEARYPFSDDAKQGQLDLIFSYYRAEEFESTVDAADNFIRENPTHPRVDYAYYLKGLAYFETEGGILERLFRVDTTRRPPYFANDSYAAFATLVERFPDSEYAEDARRRMIYLRNRLATYQIHVAEYYVRRGAWVAALGRARQVVEVYAGSPSTLDALEIMKTCYEELEMMDLAADTQRVIDENRIGQEQAKSQRKRSRRSFLPFFK